MYSKTVEVGQRLVMNTTARISPVRSRVIHLVDAQACLPGPSGEHATIALQRGKLDVALSIPNRQIPQSPHEQDEIYVVIRGRGVLVHDAKREPFLSGDLMFVAAVIEHQFEAISNDLAVWRIFYGSRGGDASE